MGESRVSATKDGYNAVCTKKGFKYVEITTPNPDEKTPPVTRPSNDNKEDKKDKEKPGTIYSCTTWL